MFCQCLSSLFSYAIRLGEVIDVPSETTHKLVILKLKKLFLTFNLEYDLANFRLCPLVTFCLHGCKYGVAAITYFQFNIVYVSIMSPRDLLYTKVERSRYLNLSS